VLIGSLQFLNIFLREKQRRVIGLDVHRSFAEVAILEKGNDPTRWTPAA
jgi:hypothetical protein